MLQQNNKWVATFQSTMRFFSQRKKKKKKTVFLLFFATKLESLQFKIGIQKKKKKS